MGAHVRTYVCEGWGLTPTLPLTPLPLSTPFTARVSSTLLPPLWGRYALPVILSHKLWYVTHALRPLVRSIKPPQATDAPACHSCRGKPQQAPASPGKPRQARSSHRNLRPGRPVAYSGLKRFHTAPVESLLLRSTSRLTFTHATPRGLSHLKRTAGSDRP